MGKRKSIEQLSIEGFKSLQNIQGLQLSNINVLIGPNGAGKSNFISIFQMLSEMVAGRLQVWTRRQGAAERILSYGVKETKELKVSIRFGLNGYDFILAPTVDGGFVFEDELLFFAGPYYGDEWIRLGTGHEESLLKDKYDRRTRGDGVEWYCYESIASWKVYHFHDTSDTAGVKRWASLHDNEYLRPDASNLAAYLFRLRHEEEQVYQQIRKTVRLAIPFFDDFVLKPHQLPSGEEQIRLLWSQRGSDYPFWPSQLSDGSIRFICLTTALLQPNPPSTVIIDEPELGLHPYAITLLGSLIRSASRQMQLIVSTQSVALVNEFSIGDLIVVEREGGATVFSRHEEQEFEVWLEDYSVGELWEKNVLGGRPGSGKGSFK